MRSPTGAADAGSPRTVVVTSGDSDAVLALAQLALTSAGWSVVDTGSRTLPRVTTRRGERLPPPVPAAVVLGSQIAAACFAARWIARGVPVALIDPADLDVLVDGVEAVRRSSAFVSRGSSAPPPATTASCERPPPTGPTSDPVRSGC